ncbi:MAG: ABC transporter permease [Planctomycetes bacterium]|nr:ABC transporter permease [Planctomycetota bacterium]
MREEFFKIREDIPLWRALFLGVLPAVLFVLIWAFLTAGGEPEQRRISPAILPSPLEVVEGIPTLWSQKASSGETEYRLLTSLWWSLRRVIVGFLIGVAVALPLGIAMGAFTKVKHLFLPLATIGGYTPIAALVPLSLLWFGTDEFQKYMFLAIATVIYVLPLVFKAVDGVDDVYLETAYTLGASTWQVVLRVMVPVALAEIYNALRLGFGVGWSYIMLAEIVNAQHGIGYMIEVARRRTHPEHVFLGILIIAVVGFLLDRVWEKAGAWLFPHRTKS